MGKVPPRYVFFFRDSILRLFLASLFIPSSLPGVLSSRVVTLGSIEIFDTHEWLPVKPIVYFRCGGENKTVLPDVKEKNLVYTFKGEESWQPLTELPDKKCKRCGLYEQDTIKDDDVYDEWEFCQSDFVDGKYVRFKQKEFNATFICHDCIFSDGKNQTSSPREEEKHKLDVGVVILISALVSAVVAGGIFAGYKYWQKRKREQDQARFLKLFEDNDDDIEDELGLGTII